MSRFGGNRYNDNSSRRGGGSFGGGGYGGGFGGRGGGGRYGGGGDSMAGLGTGLRAIQWDISQLPVFEKNFYMEHPNVTSRSDQESNAWRQQHQIQIQGQGIPKPCLSFEEASMPEYILSEVMKLGFKAPTPIQSQGWPMALLGRDMVGISATGSGKTLAFLLPAMVHINAQVAHACYS
mmetsp:Transcript_23352/g.29312  ORF Transcript_23352/g.29312 Transcript_23352/m.29312 type:complete len:179 (+) Transcript_23352:135-671(+)